MFKKLITSCILVNFLFNTLVFAAANDTTSAASTSFFSPTSSTGSSSCGEDYPPTVEANSLIEKNIPLFVSAPKLMLTHDKCPPVQIDRLRIELPLCDDDRIPYGVEHPAPRKSRAVPTTLALPLKTQTELRDKLGPVLLFHETWAALVEAGVIILDDTESIRDGYELKRVEELAVTLAKDGRYHEAARCNACAWHFRMVHQGESDPSTLTMLHYCAMDMLACGQPKLSNLAARVFEAVALERVRKLGVTHSHTLSSASMLAKAVKAQGFTDMAVRIEELCFDLRRHVYGFHHVDTLRSMNNLGAALITAGRYAKAQQVLEDCANRRTVLLGEHAQDTAITKCNLGLALYQLRRYPAAERCLREASAAFDPFIQGGNASLLLDAATCKSNLASVYRMLNTHPEHRKLAIEAESDALRQRTTLLGESHRDTLRSMHNLGVYLKEDEQHKAAYEVLLHCFGLRRTAYGDTHMETLITMQAMTAAAAEAPRAFLAPALLRRLAEHTLEMCTAHLEPTDAITVRAQRTRDVVTRR